MGRKRVGGLQSSRFLLENPDLSKTAAIPRTRSSRRGGKLPQISTRAVPRSRGRQDTSSEAHGRTLHLLKSLLGAREKPYARLRSGGCLFLGRSRSGSGFQRTQARLLSFKKTTTRYSSSGFRFPNVKEKDIQYSRHSPALLESFDRCLASLRRGTATGPRGAMAPRVSAFAGTNGKGNRNATPGRFCSFFAVPSASLRQAAAPAARYRENSAFTAAEPLASTRRGAGPRGQPARRRPRPEAGIYPPVKSFQPSGISLFPPPEENKGCRSRFPLPLPQLTRKRGLTKRF